jgi:Uma2 family endonuclease
MAAIRTPQEQRVVLRNISWQTYERLLAEHESSGAPRFTYDRGTMEIMSPLPRHERFARALESLGDALNAELDAVVDTGFGSTTFRAEEAEAGFEPDACYYIQNEPRVRGKTRLDLRVDPPPDVVVEIDLSHSSIPKLGLYARLRAPEIWRYDGDTVEILLLGPEGYIPAAESRALPGVRAAALTELLREAGALDWKSWLRRARDWARSVSAAQGE